MTVKGGSRPACAACRFQRRRCSSDCPLAPYFPANQPKIFQNVHRLYGVGNVMKILSQLKNDENKDEAMKSIIYESNIRQIYRVQGCYGLLVQMHQKLRESKQELQHIRRMIDKNNDVKQGSPDGLSDWAADIIDVENYPWFDEDGLSDGRYVVSYDWDDEETKAKLELMRQPSLLDGIQEECSDEDSEEEGLDDYTETKSGSIIDNFNSESSIKDTIHFTELGKSKTQEKLFQGTVDYVHSPT